MKIFRRVLLTRLQAISESKTLRNPDRSLCACISMSTDVSMTTPVLDAMYELMEQWPGYSFDRRYPVPGGPEAYRKAHNARTMWSRRTTYGKARWNLLFWMIDQLRREAAQHDAKTCGLSIKSQPMRASQ